MSSPSSAPTIDLAVIVASTRDGRRGHVIAGWVLDQLRSRTDVRVDLIDLTDVDLPVQYTFDEHDGVPALRDRIDRADAFIVVTPEYNHSYPASLKHAIDFVKTQWKRKTVGFVSYGGVSGGLRAVEHLRGVFGELHAHSVRDTVSFHGPWNGFGDDDRPSDPDGASAALAILVDELVWWGAALAAARNAELVVG